MVVGICAIVVSALHMHVVWGVVACIHTVHCVWCVSCVVHGMCHVGTVGYAVSAGGLCSVCYLVCVCVCVCVCYSSVWCVWFVRDLLACIM